jgi:CheY-like chemotaxis protein/HPt (histidine-containing phosphotransfer) domain-containing protein
MTHNPVPDGTMLSRNIPLNRRLLRITALALGLVVTLYLLALLMADARADKAGTRSRLQAVAEVVALQGARALQASDPGGAAASLAGLQARPEVRRAVLRRADGTVVASFPAGADAGPLQTTPANPVDQAGRIVIEQPVQLDGLRLGSLRLDADIAEQQQSNTAIALLLAAMAAAFAILLVLAARVRDAREAQAPTPVPEAAPPSRQASPAPASASLPPGAVPAAALPVLRDTPQSADPPGPPLAADSDTTVSGRRGDAAGLQASGAARLHARVLLAEDNQVNREIATVMLQAMGCKVTQSHDGAQALAAVVSRDIDLVLMDCGMPVMDGFESTRRIRAWEQAQPGRTRVPIVALTASALAGDREACLSAGMDDYLVKPVSSSRLSETLARHLSGPARQLPTPVPPAQPVTDPPAAATAPPLVYDAAVLASLPMVADGSHPGFIHKMQRMFTGSNARMLAEIDAALAAGDTQSLMRLLHSMKSASAQVGAMELSALARAFEAHLRTGGAPASQWPVQLRQAFERLQAAWPEVQPPAEPLH